MCCNRYMEPKREWSITENTQFLWCIIWKSRPLNWAARNKKRSIERAYICFFNSLGKPTFVSVWLILEARLKERNSVYVLFRSGKKKCEDVNIWGRGVTGCVVFRFTSVHVFPAFHYSNCASCLTLPPDWKLNNCLNMMLTSKECSLHSWDWVPDSNN